MEEEGRKEVEMEEGAGREEEWVEGTEEEGAREEEEEEGLGE